MTWILESPLLIVIAAAGLVGVLGWLWLSTGRKELPPLIALALLAAIGLFVAERMVDTDREKIRRRLFQMARDVESNKLDQLLSHLHPEAASISERVKGEFPRHRFEVCNIKHNLKIEVDSEKQPPEATADFNVEVRGDFFDNQYPGQRAIVAVVLTFQQTKTGQWKVADYHYRPLRDAFLRRNR